MEAGRSRTYRLMTWNVHHCVGMDRRHDPARIAGVIREYDPDVVAVQELETNHSRSRRIHQPGILADLLQMDHHYHPARIRRGSGFGNAVFSRHGLRAVQSGILPSVRLPRLQNRGALWAAVDLGGVTLQVINTHFGLMGGERLLQAEALLGERWLDHPNCRNRPAVVCGDFNATPRSRAYRLLAGTLQDAQGVAGDPKVRTWPSVLPVVRYDHVFLGRGVEARAVEVPRSRLTQVASDHLPVVMDFRLS